MKVHLNHRFIELVGRSKLNPAVKKSNQALKNRLKARLPSQQVTTEDHINEATKRPECQLQQRQLSQHTYEQKLGSATRKPTTRRDSCNFQPQSNKVEAAVEPGEKASPQRQGNIQNGRANRNFETAAIERLDTRNGQGYAEMDEIVMLHGHRKWRSEESRTKTAVQLGIPSRSRSGREHLKGFFFLCEIFSIVYIHRSIKRTLLLLLSL